MYLCQFAYHPGAFITEAVIAGCNVSNLSILEVSVSDEIGEAVLEPFSSDGLKLTYL